MGGGDARSKEGPGASSYPTKHGKVSRAAGRRGGEEEDSPRREVGGSDGKKKKKDDSVGAVYSPLLLGVCAMPKQTTFALLGVTGIYYTLKMKRPQFAMCQLSVCVSF